MSAWRVQIMAGGTGGHVFPALALARLLRAAGHEVSWLGTQRGIEARVVPAEGLPIDWLDIGGLRGKGPLALLGAPWRLLRAVTQALAILQRRRPHLVVGLGGFVTGPGGVAAWLRRVPLVIHEQNAVAGFTNRRLAPLARLVLSAFPQAFAPRGGEQVIGKPVRADIAALAAPEQRWAERAGALRLLVVGGSLGAARLNAAVAPALALCRAQGLPEFTVRHQSGTQGLAATREAYAKAGVGAEVSEFIDDMAQAYAWADLVICRAGALTVSELAVAGLPALLVPYPLAVDDHQTRNAQWLVQAGAALCVADALLTPQRLADELQQFGLDRAALLQRACRARAVATPAAAEALLQHCLAVLESR